MGDEVTQVTDANGRIFNRAGGISIPAAEDIIKREMANEATPETRIRLLIEVEGGELAEGVKVSIQTGDILLKKADQFGIDFFDPEDELMSDDAWLGLHWDRRVQMHLDLAELVDPEKPIYFVTYPVAEDQTLTIDENGSPA
jgi:hypothetical protein